MFVDTADAAGNGSSRSACPRLTVADLADAVAQLCAQAGLPADRVSAAAEALDVDGAE